MHAVSAAYLHTPIALLSRRVHTVRRTRGYPTWYWLQHLKICVQNATAPINRARRQSGFPTFISCQRQDAHVLPKRRQSHQGDKLCDVSTVPLVARGPVLLACGSDADGEPHYHRGINGSRYSDAKIRRIQCLHCCISPVHCEGDNFTGLHSSAASCIRQHESLPPPPSPIGYTHNSLSFHTLLKQKEMHACCSCCTVLPWESPRATLTPSMGHLILNDILPTLLKSTCCEC